MGRRLILAALIIGLACGVAFADETGGANYNSPNDHASGLAEFLNEQDCIDHNHAVNHPERDDAAGLGVDLVVWQDDNPDAKLEEVVIEEKYDFENEENSVFLVVRWNIFKLFSNKEE